MESNPFEQQNNKIAVAKEELKKNLSNIFDEGETKFISKIDNFILQMEDLQKVGLVFNKEEIINGLIESIRIKEKEEFVTYLSKILEPILILKITQASVIEKAEKQTELENGIKEREFIMNDPSNIKLSEVLYSDLGKKEAHIHLAPSRDFMTREKIEDFDLEIKNGLKNLAKIIEPMKNIENIVATSWIVSKSPKRLEKLGFIIEGEISKEEKNNNLDVYGNDNNMTVSRAFMSREKFDELYLN